MPVNLPHSEWLQKKFNISLLVKCGGHVSMR
ncbi:hypothetical protein X564_05110 [Pseudoalteromonas agarivorans]|nr:hypothetical protein X564_05110 [Pseudoalteromonas agarivorans]